MKQIISMALLIGLGFTIACSKKDNNPNAMPPIHHELGQCPAFIMQAPKIRRVGNGIIMPQFGDGGLIVDGAVHKMEGSREEASYQGGCMNNSIRVNVFAADEWVHMSITPAADGGMDLMINHKGEIKTEHVPPDRLK